MNALRPVVSFHVLTIWIGTAVVGVQPPRELKIGYLISYSGPFSGKFYSNHSFRSSLFEFLVNDYTILFFSCSYHLFFQSLLVKSESFVGALQR